MIAKVDNNDSDIIPEKLLTLKPKVYKSGLILLIEHNIFVSRGSKEMAEEAVNNMEVQNTQKSSTNKQRKAGQQMSIQSAFANAKEKLLNDLSHSTDSSSNEDN
jgi:hypothetical protein